MSRMWSAIFLSGSVSEPEWDNDLARATDAAVSRKRSLSRTSAENGATI